MSNKVHVDGRAGVPGRGRFILFCTGHGCPEKMQKGKSLLVSVSGACTARNGCVVSEAGMPVTVWRLWLAVCASTVQMIALSR